MMDERGAPPTCGDEQAAHGRGGGDGMSGGRRHLCLDCAWRADIDWETMTVLCTRTGKRGERGRAVIECDLFKRRLEAVRGE